jgi:hypothetical protein
MEGCHTEDLSSSAPLWDEMSPIEKANAARGRRFLTWLFVCPLTALDGEGWYTHAVGR